MLTLLASVPHGVPAVPAVASVCGFAAGTFGVATSWPQAWRLWAGRRHSGLSLSANVLGVLFPVGWLLYGVASHSAVQIITTAVALAGGVAILIGHLVLARPRIATWLPLLVVGLAVLGGSAALGRTECGLVASASTIAGVLPQVMLLGRGRRSGTLDARGVSRLRWLLAASCNGLWMVYGAIVGDRVIFVNSTIVMLLGVAVVALASSSGAERAADQWLAAQTPRFECDDSVTGLATGLVSQPA